MGGDLSAVMAVDSLSKKEHLYALGALKDLKGELQIFDGKSFTTKVQDSAVVVDNSFDQEASLIVYANVSDWIAVSIPATVNSQKSLEEFIEAKAAAHGFSLEKPVPFLIEGTAKSLRWHVIDWPNGDNQHTHEKHRTSGLNGNLENVEVTVVGFFSLHHTAVFTHHTTNVHMHFKTQDGQLAGHLDQLELGDNMTLKLPKL
jgi:acetolactate decarboxylase